MLAKSKLKLYRFCMAEVKIIKQGYFKWTGTKSCKASSNVVLIIDGKTSIIIDAGCVGEEKKIIAGLKKEKLMPEKIDFVVVTHYHPDHIGCLRLFKNATFLDAVSEYKKDKFSLRMKKQISPNVKLVRTPGHTADSCTVLVKTSKGVIAVAGDLFWFSRKENIDKGFVEDGKAFKKNREKILKISDWVVPGHSDIFRVKR